MDKVKSNTYTKGMIVRLSDNADENPGEEVILVTDEYFHQNDRFALGILTSWVSKLAPKVKSGVVQAVPLTVVRLFDLE